MERSLSRSPSHERSYKLGDPNQLLYRGSFGKPH